MKISLEEIQRVANQGPFYPDWDFYPLGTLQPSCLWERVVLSKYVHPGHSRV